MVNIIISVLSFGTIKAETCIVVTATQKVHGQNHLRLGQGCIFGCALCLGFPGSSDMKESARNAGDLGLIPRWGRSPGEGNGSPLQYSFLPGEFHGQRSLVGYSLWGGKESDTTGRLTHNIALFIVCFPS